MESVLPIWVSPAWAAAAVVAAAALAWVGARAVVAVPAGPTLPERLQQWRGRHQAGLAIAIGLLVFSGIHAWWAIPAVWLAFQAAAHRVRRRVFGDTWSLAAQIRWNLRVLVGVLGFWWMVSLAPFVLAAVAAPAWAGAAAAVGLLAWNHFYGEMVLLALGATPLDRPALAEAFEPVLARARIPRPRLFRAGPRGTLVANAFAMASTRGDVVLFFDGFLDHASPAEAAAVLGHEVGHLEEFATRRVRLYAPGALLAIAGAIVSVAVALGVWPAWMAAGWFAVPMAALIARAFRSQDRERSSDRRAVELCGDGEALVRALVLLHALSHVPRRFDPEIERHATHPSLARRIAAIRAIGGVPPALIEPRAFGCDGGPSRAVVFDATRFALVTVGGAADRTNVGALLQQARQVDAVAYTELTELRLAPARDGSATLIATDRQRHQRRVTIAPADVAAVQAMLDLADQRLPATMAPPPDLRPLGRIAALVATCVALPAFAWGVLGAALLACIRPTAPLLAAVSAGLGVVAASGRPPQISTDWSGLLLLTAAIACGALAVRHVRADRRDAVPFRVDAFLVAGFVVTGIAAALPAALIVVLGGGDLARLHAATRAFTMAGPAFAALGGFCMAVPRRAARVAGAGAFAAMAAAVTLGSDDFRDLVLPDPLIAAAPALVVDDLTRKAVASVSEAGSHQHVWLAPDARHVLLQETRHDDGEGPDRYVVIALDGWRREIVAAEVAFVDAASLVVLRDGERARTLSVEPIRGGATRWSLQLDDPPAGDFEVDASGRWRLEPYLEADSPVDAVRLEGRIGESAVRRTPIARPSRTRGAWRERGVAATGASIQVARRWNGGMPTGLDWLVPGLGWNTDLERLGGRAPGVLARTRLELDCHGPTLTSDAATCFAKTGDETFVWDVAAEAGAPVPRAWIAGRVTTLWHDDTTALFWRDRDLLLLWRGTNRATRIGPGPECPCPHDAAYANGRLATLTTGPDRSTVRLYAIAPPGGNRGREDVSAESRPNVLPTPISAAVD